jgi:hypothetical protein
MPEPAELIRLPKTAESLGTTMRHMDARLCDSSTMSRKKPKTNRIGRHFIKAPQTMVWSDNQNGDFCPTPRKRKIGNFVGF